MASLFFVFLSIIVKKLPVSTFAFEWICHVKLFLDRTLDFWVGLGDHWSLGKAWPDNCPLFNNDYDSLFQEYDSSGKILNTFRAVTTSLVCEKLFRTLLDEPYSWSRPLQTVSFSGQLLSNNCVENSEKLFIQNSRLEN